MPHDDFRDSTLVLVGHGSTENKLSAAPVFQHAAELRRRGLFADVREGFWKQEPSVVDLVRSLSVPRAFIVPIFVSEGYFSSEIIPRALGFAPDQAMLQSAGSTFYYCRPIGTHDSMTSVLLAQAKGIVAQFPFPRAPQLAEITLFIAGHGTEQNENSRAAIDRQVTLIRARNEFAAVEAVFLDEEPRISEYDRLAKTRHVVVVPFFISDGMHTQEDIPVLLGESKQTVQQRLAAGQGTWRNPTERRGKLIWYAPAVGTDPHVADVILERVREATDEHR